MLTRRARGGGCGPPPRPAAEWGAFFEAPGRLQHVENCWWGGVVVPNATEVTGRFDDESL